MTNSEIISAQKVYFNSNITKDTSFRIEQLKKFSRLIKENETSLYEAISKDFGKSEFETYVTELSLLYHELDTCIKSLKKWSKIKKVPTNITNFPARSYIIHEPLGTTLIIGAWNYPFQLSLVPAITAIAAGNTVILKPSELPSSCSHIMAKLINDNFPTNFFHVVEGGVETTSDLLSHHFDKIFFTGSIPVGRIVYQAAAKNLTPVTLELGGKSPTFVFADCDLKMTVKRLVWAKYLNAGQTCVAPDYVLVEEEIKDEFLTELKNEILTSYSFKSGLPKNYLQIINNKNFTRLSELIDSEKLYCGGDFNVKERIIHPTVMHNISFNDKIMEDEIFGPILPVISFSNLDETIKAVKARPKPLSCYIYTKDKKRIKQLLKQISFGGGAINDSLMHLTNSNLPFGGVGYSGIGSYHGKSGFDSFSHYKSILEKRNWLEPNFKYAPYSSQKLTWLRRLLG